MNAYSEYKDSGIDWIGKIPKGWEVKPLKYIAEIKTGDKDTVNREDDGKYPFFVRSQTIERINTYSYDGEAVLTAGDGDVGKIFHYINGKFDYHQRVYRISDFKEVSAKYFYYYVKENLRKEILKHNAKTTVDSLRLPMFKNFKVAFGSFDEQKRIVDFLDNKTDIVDNLVVNKQKLIELLKEQRLAIINHAVTKGLNKDVELVDSEIEWVGKIPKHWNLRKISRSFKKVSSGTTPKSTEEKYYEGGNINWVNTGDLNDKELFESKKKITEQALTDYSTLKIYPSNTLLIAMYGATIGRVSILKIEATTNQACCALSDSDFFDTYYVYFWFLSNREYMINMSYGGGQPNISQEIIRSLKIPQPPVSEQKEIVKFLNTETSQIDKSIEKIQKEIELLEEYKEALISEAVTGKIKIEEAS